MPTPDDSNLNPFTDELETDEEKRERLAREQRLRDMINKLPTKQEIDELLGQRKAPQ